MKSKKDIVWINTLKALCIIAVFFVHCQSYYGLSISSLNLFVNTFYVNAFFFVSGYLLFWKQLSSPKIDENKTTYMTSGGGKLLFLNVFYRIIIPSILFSAVEFFPSCVIQGRGIDIGFALYKTIGGGTYWFTSALVVAELILLLLFWTRKRNVWFYATLCVAFGLAGLVIVNLDILHNGIWAWRQGLIALIFLSMGGLFWKYEKKIDKQLMHWWFVAPLLVAYILMVIGLKEYNDPLISTLTIQPLGFVTSAMACILLVWMCKKLPEIKLLSFIGQNSLGFYFLSGALPITFGMIANKYLVSGSTFMMLAIWITCIIIAYVAVLLINRWLPWLWDLRQLKSFDKP